MAWVFDKAFINAGNTRVRVILKETIIDERRERVYERKQGQTLTAFKNMVKAEVKIWRDDLNTPAEAESDVSGQIEP